MSNRPIVMISSYPPRLCGIATFCEEAREFLRKRHPDRRICVISHLDGRGSDVFPLIDMSRHDWWKPIAEKIEKLDPYVVHIEHEYGLYDYQDTRGQGDGNKGFLALLEALEEWPVVVEPHTVHGRLTDFEADFLYNLCQRADVVLLKCHYQKWRLNWNFYGRGWETPRNIMVVPHGARPDKSYPPEKIPLLRKELGLDLPYLGDHFVGLVGWIQSNKRWDILTSMWEGIEKDIKESTGESWDLLAAGTLRDPAHQADYDLYRGELNLLEKKGLAHYYEFVPRGDIYYKIMAVCDFIVLPSTDETQSGTLARVFAANKPFVTTAPMEGLTAQTLASEGGLLFTTKDMLRQKVIRLACNPDVREELARNVRNYLQKEVSWEIVVEQYDQAYRLARKAEQSREKVELPLEF